MSEFDDDEVYREPRLYAGPVHAGPLKGKWVTHDKPYYRVRPEPAYMSTPVSAIPTPSADFTYQEITYNWDFPTKSWVL